MGRTQSSEQMIRCRMIAGLTLLYTRPIDGDWAACGLRRAILPVDPVYGTAGEIGIHGFTEGCEKGLLAEALEKLEAFELVLDWILHLCETQLDPGGVQRVLELADSVGRGDVDAGDRLCCDDEPADRRR